MLGCVAHASTHPKVCVSPGSSPMKYGFFRFSTSCLAESLFGCIFKAVRGKSTRIRFPPTASLSRFHAASDGQVASEGRRRIKPVFAQIRLGNLGRSSAADPIAFKKARLFIDSVPRQSETNASEGRAAAYLICI